MALANYWRSAANTSTFYACKAAGACEAGPAAGDAACREGQQGPLCDVCDDGWFKFSGQCRWARCSAGGSVRSVREGGCLMQPPPLPPLLLDAPQRYRFHASPCFHSTIVWFGPMSPFLAGH